MKKSTQTIIDIFKEISAIPRCSKQEEKIIQWVRQWTETRGFHIKSDSAGNLVVSIPASKGFENSPIIAIQGHLDMVCEKASESLHDFSKDPIKVIVDGDWLKADGTTLGSDNGIGLAMAMALALDDTIAKPPLELLFTIDEETGLTGATSLESGVLKAEVLLNLDSEEEGVFTVGCAGGQDTRIVWPIQWTNVPENHVCWSLKVHGVKGGHSGIDIHRQRANAIQILARTIGAAQKTIPIFLSNIAGGKAHNAIPRESTAWFWCPADQIAALENCFAEMIDTFTSEYAAPDPGLKLSLSMVEKPRENDAKALIVSDSKKLVSLLLSLPHGVYRMSDTIEGLVETSSNLAKIEINEDRVELQTSQRSSMMSRMEEITCRIKSAAFLAGAVTEDHNQYPPWEPDLDSALLARCRQVYETIFDTQPKVQAIHAGLECGVIGAKHPGMEMISFGPNIHGAHSPEEKAYIPSIENVWHFLRSLVASFTFRDAKKSP